MSYAFTHIRLLVSNFAECFRFYRDVLQLPVIMGDENEPYAEFKTGYSILSLFVKDYMAQSLGVLDTSSSTATGVGSAVLIFAVDNVDQTFAELQQKGVSVVKEPATYDAWLLRAAHLRDPAGNIIEINQSLSSYKALHKD